MLDKEQIKAILVENAVKPWRPRSPYGATHRNGFRDGLEQASIVVDGILREQIIREVAAEIAAWNNDIPVTGEELSAGILYHYFSEVKGYERVQMTPSQIFNAMLDGEEFYTDGRKMFWDGNQFLMQREVGSEETDRILYINDDHVVSRKTEIKTEN